MLHLLEIREKLPTSERLRCDSIIARGSLTRSLAFSRLEYFTRLDPHSIYFKVSSLPVSLNNTFISGDHVIAL